MIKKTAPLCCRSLANCLLHFATCTQANEVPMPNVDGSTATVPGNDAQAGAGTANAAQGVRAVVPDEQLVAQLVAMGGFPENGCKRAAIAVNNSSAGLFCCWLVDFVFGLEGSSIYRSGWIV